MKTFPTTTLARALAAGLAVGAALVAYTPEAHADPRIRGGFSLNGGYFGAEDNVEHTGGGAISVAGRVGVQIGDVFGVYYQNTPIGWFVFENGATVGGSDFNSVLADFTLGGLVGLGIGPSLDLVTVGQLHGKGSIVEPGAHARVALLLGSSAGDRRQAFAIGLDPHLTYFDGGALIAITAGIGAEWY